MNKVLRNWLVLLGIVLVIGLAAEAGNGTIVRTGEYAVKSAPHSHISYRYCGRGSKLFEKRPANSPNTYIHKLVFRGSKVANGKVLHLYLHRLYLSDYKFHSVDSFWRVCGGVA